MTGIANDSLRPRLVRIQFMSQKITTQKSGLMVGMTGFEPATPSSQARCATKLRYIPMFYSIVFFAYSAPTVFPLLERLSIVLVGRVKLRYNQMSNNLLIKKLIYLFYKQQRKPSRINI